MPFLSEEELQSLHFLEVGKNVKISSLATIYHPQLMRLSDNSRIDDFCVISGSISLGKNTHIAAQCLLNAGSYRIIMEDFSGLAYGCKVMTVSDDYSGKFLTNPTVDTTFRNSTGGDVILKRHAIVGANSVILPEVVIGEGVAVGAMSLVNSSLDAWGVYAGIPVRRIKDRVQDMLAFLDE